MVQLSVFTFLISSTIVLPMFLKFNVQWQKILYLIMGSWLFSLVPWTVFYYRGFFPSFLWFVVVEIFFVFFYLGMIIFICFFRDPERTPPNQDKIIVSPADGVVRYIYPIKSDRVPVVVKGETVIPLVEFLKMNLNTSWSYLIGIEMNVLDVHVNRAPISGVITNQQYTPGSFISLRKSESMVKNERMVTVIYHEEFHLAIIQIASRLVRRIVSYVQQGDQVKLGQRIGMIRFGSQVDLLLPTLDHLEILVKKGDRLKTGLTIVARYG